MNKFDFREALFCLECGLVVGLTLNGIERRYYINQFGDIMCTPNGKEHLTYKVKEFKVDAIMSKEWVCYD